MKPVPLALLAISLLAQESRFEARARLVVLPATVTDAQGNLVDGLDTPDFLVLDNGRAQKVTLDTTGTGVAPVALVIAVQSSGISAPVLDKVRKTAGMIQPLITGDRGCAALVAFSERVTWLQECTSDSDALKLAFWRLTPGEYKKARMLDAADDAIHHLSKRPNARKVLLLVSESRDRGSEAELAVVTAAAQSAGVTVYAATYSVLKTAFTSKARGQQGPQAPPPAIPNPNRTLNGAPPSKYNPMVPPPEDRIDILAAVTELKRMRLPDTTQVLTAGTGGGTLPFSRQKGLEDAIEKLAAELHAQYVLSFAPEASGPGYHVLEVKVVRRAELRVRARPGYWSEGETR
ncbi:MAG: VWA domain-containing protein [Acidobacteriota bacterium]